MKNQLFSCFISKGIGKPNVIPLSLVLCLLSFVHYPSKLKERRSVPCPSKLKERRSVPCPSKLKERRSVPCPFSLSFVLCLLSFVFSPLSSSAQIPSYVPTSGLVGWWPFNGNANDESGNGNSGTVNGATLTSDRFGVANKAYSFDGVNDRIFAGNTNLTQNYSISFWAFISSNTFAYPIGFGINSVSSDGYGIGFSSSNPPPSCPSPINTYFIYDGLSPTGCFNVAYTQNVQSTFSWKSIILTKTNNIVQVYVNGVLEISTTALSLQGIINLYFGVRSDVLFYFNGKLDDIGLWNRALTQQEITNLYTSSVPPTITTTASSSLVNCGESTTLTASSTSAVQPCIKADLPLTLQNGLVGYWPFCGNANDASGNGNNGTVNGATLTTDRFGNVNSAYSFDGVGNYVNVLDANSLDFSNNFTLSGWYQTNDINQTDQTIIGKGRAISGTGYHLLVNTSLNLMQFGYNNNVINGGATTPATPSNLSGWHFLTGTYDGSAAKIFIDGILLNSVYEVYSLQNSSIPLNIGRETSGLGRYFNGKLDDIAIYNRALSASEVQQLYALGTVNYSWSTGATTPSITVAPAQSTSYTCTATNSAGSTTSSVSVTVADTLTWTGAFDTDWHKPCNWSPQFVPKCCNNVSVPLTTNQPIVSGVAAAEDLTIFSTNGAQVTVNTGANLQIADCPTTITTTVCPSLAVISTSAVTSVTQTTAVSGGTISYQGSSAIAARGICWSTSINPTIANSNTNNGTGIGAFTSNLSGLVAGTTCYLRAYATNGSGPSYGNQVSFTTQTLAAQYPVGSVFCASGPTAIVDVTNPTTGKTWMDRNLGATQAATSSTDAAAYGDLYQWGRGSDGHQCRTSAIITTLSSLDAPTNGNFIKAPLAPNDWRSPQNNNLWQGVNGVNIPCPNGYRLPTEIEINNDRISWINNTSVGAFNSPLKIPLAGYRAFGNGSISEVGVRGCYWTSTVSNTISISLNFNGAGAFMDNPNRSNGYPVRCIKN